MSKRNRRHQYQRQQIVHERRDISREQEVLNSNAQDFFSHHPVVKELLSKLPTASETEARNIGLILQQIIRGDGSLLSNELDPAVAEEINHIRAKAAEIQKAQERYDTDQMGFVQEVFDRADKIMPVGAARDKAIAQGIEAYQRAKENAAANAVHRKLLLRQQLENGPKETIHVTNETEDHLIDRVKHSVKVPTVIRLMGHTWVLEEGDHTVPSVVAQRWREIEASRSEIAERKAASLATRSVDKSHDQMEIRNQRIDAKYRVKRQRVPFVGEEI